MDEFCLVTDLATCSADAVLDAASEFLLGCAGIAMTSDYENGMTIDMPAVNTTRGPQASAAMFECVALVLCQLARYHSRWISSDGPAPVVLWNQIVPGTGGPRVRQSSAVTMKFPPALHKASNTGKRFATNQAQGAHWDTLKEKTFEMFLCGMPENDSQFAEIPIRVALSVNVLAGQGRDDPALGSISFEYSNEMQKFARQGLIAITRYIDTSFPAATTADTILEPYLPSSTLRPRPATTNSMLLRQ